MGISFCLSPGLQRGLGRATWLIIVVGLLSFRVGESVGISVRIGACALGTSAQVVTHVELRLNVWHAGEGCGLRDVVLELSVAKRKVFCLHLEAGTLTAERADIEVQLRLISGGKVNFGAIYPHLAFERLPMATTAFLCSGDLVCI